MQQLPVLVNFVVPPTKLRPWRLRHLFSPWCNGGNLRFFAGGISRGWDLKGSDSAALRHVQLGPTMVPLGVVCSCWSAARRDLGVPSGCWGFDVWSCYTCPKPTHDRWDDAISRSTIVYDIYIYTHTVYSLCICVYIYDTHIHIILQPLGGGGFRFQVSVAVVSVMVVLIIFDFSNCLRLITKLTNILEMA